MSAQLNLISNLDDSDPCVGAMYEHSNSARVRVGAATSSNVVVYPASKHSGRVPRYQWTVKEFLNEFIRVEED